MRIGNRERVVIGVIVAIGAIFALHWFIFRERARQYEAAKAQFDGITSTLQQIGSPRSLPDIYKFQYETINYGLDFYHLIEDAKLTLPAYYSTEVSADRQHEEIWGYYNTLMDMWGKEGIPQLTFMGPDQWGGRLQGFDMHRSLPTQIVESGTQVSDLVAQLVDADAVINALPANAPLLEQKRNEYAQMLLRVGLNLRFRDYLEQTYGEPAALLYSLNRVDLLRKNMDFRDMGGVESEEEFAKRLEGLLRVAWPESTLAHAKQLSGLIDLIQRAGKHEVQSVQTVNFWDPAVVYWWADRDTPQTAQQAADQQSGAAARPGGGWGQNWGQGQEQGMQPSAAPGGTKDEREIVAVNVPVDITLVGPNLSVMSFLYEICNIRRFYQIDAMDIASIPNQENVIYCRSTIGIMTHFATFAYPSATIQEKLDELEKTKSEIAQKSGASELAAEEGYVPGGQETPAPPEQPAEEAPTTEGAPADAGS